MSRSTYVIVGGGMTADAAIRGIREVDSVGTITLVGSEPAPPYKRPPLSKGLWNGKALDRIWCKTDELGADLRLGRTVRWIDPRTKCIVDDRGDAYEYETLLLATGSSPRRLPLDDNEIIYFRTLDDYYRLRQHTEDGQRFAVIGGGFIGSEITAALVSIGRTVSLIFPGKAIGDGIFPTDLACFLNDYYRDKGVEVLSGHSVADVRTSDDDVLLTLMGSESGTRSEVRADGIVAGVGTRPNTELAELAGLTIDDGVVVDRSLRTSDPHIYAAGDVANFCLAGLHERRRVEHEDNARTMGRHAGRAMAGATATYDHIPSFYSDLFELGYEAVGVLDPRLDTIADWTVPFREGVVYYLREGRVRGVLLWNVWGQVDAARELIRQPGPFAPQDLKGRLRGSR